MNGPNYSNNAIKLLKLFNYASHEGNYPQGFEAAATPQLFKIALKTLFIFETFLTTNQYTLFDYLQTLKELLTDYADNYPDNIDFDNLGGFANDRLNYHFFNTNEVINPEDTKTNIKIFGDYPKSDNLTNLLMDHFFNLKLLFLGLSNIGDFLDYLEEFSSDFVEYYSELLEDEEGQTYI